MLPMVIKLLSTVSCVNQNYPNLPLNQDLAGHSADIDHSIPTGIELLSEFLLSAICKQVMLVDKCH